MSLFALSAEFERMRYRAVQAEYDFGRSAGELEELRMMLHQWVYTRSQTARSYLLAVAREHQILLEELSGERERMEKRA